MMNGELDSATPYEYAIALADHFNGPNQHWVGFPQGSHHLATGTPLPSDPDHDHCDVKLQVAFVQDPTSAPDTSCVDEVLPIDFAGTPELANELFGTGDFYDLVSPPPPTPPSPSPRIQSIRRALKAARLRVATQRLLIDQL